MPLQFRKHMGYAHIPQHFARRINTFYLETFNAQPAPPLPVRAAFVPRKLG
jgi:hypothetical protein